MHESGAAVIVCCWAKYEWLQLRSSTAGKISINAYKNNFYKNNFCNVLAAFKQTSIEAGLMSEWSLQHLPFDLCLPDSGQACKGSRLAIFHVQQLCLSTNYWVCSVIHRQVLSLQVLREVQLKAEFFSLEDWQSCLFYGMLRGPLSPVSFITSSALDFCVYGDVSTYTSSLPRKSSPKFAVQVRI